MQPNSRIINDTTLRAIHFGGNEAVLFSQLCANNPGWSQFYHYSFFGAVLAELMATCETPVILVCGVYRGLDLSLLADLASRAHAGRAVELHGVDLFSAEPCADWPEEKRSLSWEQAFGCRPPSRIAAQQACPQATLYQANSVEFLKEHAGKFDFIYLDTSHDEATVRAEITAVQQYGKPGVILAGDDYTAGGAQFDCGVARALEALLPTHVALFDRLWLAPNPLPRLATEGAIATAERDQLVFNP